GSLRARSEPDGRRFRARLDAELRARARLLQRVRALSRQLPAGAGAKHPAPSAALDHRGDRCGRHTASTAGDATGTGVSGKAPLKRSSVRQAEGEYIFAGGHGEVLFPIEDVRHGRSLPELVGLELPENFAGAGIGGNKETTVVAKENETGYAGDSAAPGIAT